MHAMLGAQNLLPSAGGYGAQLWGLPVPQGELRLVGMVPRGDFERVLHLPDSATITALSGAEYGLKLGSQLFIKHIVESGLAAKGNSLQEGDLILKVWGPQGVEHSLGASSAPLWGTCPWLVSLQGPAMAVLEEILSVPTPCSSPSGCPRDPAGTLYAQIPAARAGGTSCWHTGVVSTLLSPLCVCVPTG